LRYSLVPDSDERNGLLNVDGGANLINHSPEQPSDSIVKSPSPVESHLSASVHPSKGSSTTTTTVSSDCLALDPATRRREVFNYQNGNHGVQQAHLNENDSSEFEISPDSDDQGSEKALLIENLKTLTHALNQNKGNKISYTISKCETPVIKNEKNGVSKNSGSVSVIESEQVRTTNGILKERELLKISNEHSIKKRKNVRFLDSAGLPLVQVKEFDETQELLEKIQLEELKVNLALTKKAANIDENKPLFKCAFEQPAADYLKFRQILDQKFEFLDKSWPSIKGGARHAIIKFS